MISATNLYPVGNKAYAMKIKEFEGLLECPNLWATSSTL